MSGQPRWRGSTASTTAGQSWWQALPLGPTGYGDSPYQSLSSFAGNALLISPEWLIEDGLLSATDCARGQFSSTTVDFDAVKRFKYALLETAWKNFSAGTRSEQSASANRQRDR